MAEPESLSLIISYERPIELLDLAIALEKFGMEFERFVHAEGYEQNGDLPKLYIKEIGQGSIVVELLALYNTISTLIDHGKAAVEYVKTLKTVYDWYSGRSTEAEPPKLSAKDLANFRDILTPVAHDSRGSITVNASEGSVVLLSLALNSTEANAIQNRITNQLAKMKQPTGGRFEQQLFYWYQARNEANATAGDRGIIPAISDRPAKVIFYSEDIKAQMLREALFAKAFVVDVEVHSMESRPVLYKILQVHQAFDPDEVTPKVS